MHEASITQGLLEIANKSIQDYVEKNSLAKAPKVKEIICEAGLLSCFEPETLAACFDIFSEGTYCENSTLKVEITPLHCKCFSCKKEFDLRKRNFKCPFCKSGEISFKGGNGLILKEINLIDEENYG